MTRSTSPTLTHQVPILTVPLGLQLPLARLTYLRKTISAIGGEGDDLLHNHETRERVIYRYPLVQYKSFHQEAAIIGIGEDGCRSLQSLFSMPNFSAIFSEGGVMSNEKEMVGLHLEDRTAFGYSIYNWLPLNDQNYREWQSEHSIVRRMALLEKCLTGHVLKFCSAIGWLLPPKGLHIELTDIQPTRKPRELHDNRFRASFDARFRANILLPEHVGLGKGVAHGMGTLRRLD